jgi:hypothetical protein
MAPLSRTRRKLYFAALVAIFAVATPILIGYAQGYRLSDLGDAFKLIRTGGVYVAVGEVGVTVSLDGEERETTSFISRNVLVQNLFAGGYHVTIEKEGFVPWAKELQVYPSLVTEWRPALVPDPVPLAEVYRTATSTPAATGTPVVSRPNPRHAEVVALFAPQPARASSSPARLAVTEALAEGGRRDLEKEATLEIAGDIAAWTSAGVLRYAWLGKPDAAPHYMCSPEGCTGEELVALPNPVLGFEFVPGRSDLFVVTTKTGAWLVEADGRGSRNVTQLVPGEGIEVRAAGEALVFRRDGRYWELEI